MAAIVVPDVKRAMVCPPLAPSFGLTPLYNRQTMCHGASAPFRHGNWRADSATGHLLPVSVVSTFGPHVLGFQTGRRNGVRPGHKSSGTRWLPRLEDRPLWNLQFLRCRNSPIPSLLDGTLLLFTRHTGRWTEFRSFVLQIEELLGKRLTLLKRSHTFIPGQSRTPVRHPVPLGGSQADVPDISIEQ